MHVDFKQMAMVLDDGKVVGLLTSSNLHNLYCLKPMEAKWNKEYLDGFHVKFPKSYHIMKDWYCEEESFKDRDGITKYSPKEFISPTQYLTVMLSHLHGEAYYTNFKAKWIPIAHGELSADVVFNWDNRLS